MMKAGFSRLDVTPPLGSDLSGYFHRRSAKGVLDPLYLNALSIECNGEILLLFAIDYIGINLSHSNKIRSHISERTGVPSDHIMISALHQHTSPCLSDSKFALTELRDDIYIDVLYRKFGDAGVMAIDDLKEAKMRSASAEAEPKIAFVRRYTTAKGEFVTNPRDGEHILTGRCAEADNTVRLLRFERSGAPDIALVNFSTHPDLIGGEYISADWPGFTRRFVEQDLPNTKCIFFTGCQGDSNHVDRFKPFAERIVGGSGYAHSEYMGRTVANAVVRIFDDAVEQTDEGGIFASFNVIYNKTNVEGKEKYDECKAWYDDYEAGKFERKPTATELAYARRIIMLRTAPDSHPVPITVMGVGNVVFVGFGGEAFTAYGEKMRSLVPGKFVLCSVCSNGYQGYLPTEEAFYQGGYESGGSIFTPTLEKEIVSAVKDALVKSKII